MDADGTAPTDVHVLVVDDDEAVRGLVVTVLEMEDYTVHAASRGEDALEVVETVGTALSLVVLDRNLDGLSGPATYARIRERAPTLPVLLVSGVPEDEAMQDIAPDTRRHLHFLQKPFVPDELRTRVAEVLEAAS